jgi:membrane peptidoglycan carboxypeptidase
VRPFRLYTLLSQRRRRLTRRAKSFRQRLSRGSLGVGAALSLFLMIAIVYLGIQYANLTADLPSLEQLPILLNPEDGMLLEPTRLYDRSGQHLLLTLENPGIPRRYLFVNPDQPGHFSPRLTQVSVALLDPDFWKGPGFAWDNLTETKPITMAETLVDKLLLQDEPPGALRPLRMRLLAAQVVAQFGRTKVLEWYLNSAYFGHLAFGAESAAQLYLGKSASDLDLAEVALLVALIETPALNPLDAPAAALERQQEVLDRLDESGAFNSQEISDAHQKTLSIQTSPAPQPLVVGDFSNLVLNQLDELLTLRRLERGGLRVITTLDIEMQSQLFCAIEVQLQRLEGSQATGLPQDLQGCEAALLLPTFFPPDPPYPEDLMANAIMLDPKTGQVLALLGETTVKGEKSITVSYEPGSLLSPFVVMSSFARGMGPATLVWDIPLEISENNSIAETLSAHQNPDGNYHGPIRLRVALANDYILPLTKLLSQIGSNSVWKLAEPLGLNNLSDNDDANNSLLFEGGSVKLTEIAQAYSSFANQGNVNGWRSTHYSSLQPNTILRVENLAGQRLLEMSQPESQSVLSPQLSYLVHHILSDEIARQPSLGYPNPLSIGRPAGAKIGQVADKQQIWTAGYTTDKLAVIWLGLPGDTEGNNAGYQLEPEMAAGVWHAIMQYASNEPEASGWETPPGITRRDVCDPSGQLPTTDCPLVVNELFLFGNEPTTADTLYQAFLVNRETGLLATIFTPLELVEERVYLVPPSEALEWARVSNQPLPPADYDIIRAPAPVPGVEISSPDNFAYIGGKVLIKGSASGEDFSEYELQVGQGLNPRSWLQIGEQVTSPVTNGTLGTWDTQGLDGLYVIRLIVLRSDNQIDMAATQVSIDNTSPDISVPYPKSGQVFDYQYGAEINFRAEISDSVGVERVIWILDGETIKESTLPPFIIPWRMIIGEHSLVVEAFDLSGNKDESGEITFSVE